MTPPWKQHLDSLQIKDLNQIFRTSKPVIGMVHCWPLPGAPGYSGYSMQAIIDNALRDTEMA
jgi:predicted TIM-barrel enzyme